MANRSYLCLTDDPGIDDVAAAAIFASKYEIPVAWLSLVVPGDYNASNGRFVAGREDALERTRALRAVFAEYLHPTLLPYFDAFVDELSGQRGEWLLIDTLEIEALLRIEDAVHGIEWLHSPPVKLDAVQLSELFDRNLLEFDSTHSFVVPVDSHAPNSLVGYGWNRDLAQWPNPAPLASFLASPPKAEAPACHVSMTVEWWLVPAGSKGWSTLQHQPLLTAANTLPVFWGALFTHACLDQTQFSVLGGTYGGYRSTTFPRARVGRAEAIQNAAKHRGFYASTFGDKLAKRFEHFVCWVSERSDSAFLEVRLAGKPRDATLWGLPGEHGLREQIAMDLSAIELGEPEAVRSIRDRVGQAKSLFGRYRKSSVFAGDSAKGKPLV